MLLILSIGVFAQIILQYWMDTNMLDSLPLVRKRARAFRYRLATDAVTRLIWNVCTGGIVGATIGISSGLYAPLIFLLANLGYELIKWFPGPRWGALGAHARWIAEYKEHTVTRDQESLVEKYRKLIVKEAHLAGIELFPEEMEKLINEALRQHQDELAARRQARKNERGQAMAAISEKLRQNRAR